MTRFKRDFVRRYEGLEVPLVEALDENFGVGFGVASELPSVLTGITFRTRQDPSMLSPAQWTISRDEFAPLATGSQFERLHAFRRLCRRLRLPRYFYSIEDDGRLVVDAENALSAASFIQRLNRQDVLRLAEMRPAYDRLGVSSPEGHFFSKIVLPLVEDSSAISDPVPKGRATRHAVRLYMPTGAWLFVKLYCGAGNADRVLRDVVAPVVREALGERVADRWFFVRYGDPDWHIRLRIHGLSMLAAQHVQGLEHHEGERALMHVLL